MEKTDQPHGQSQPPEVSTGTALSSVGGELVADARVASNLHDELLVLVLADLKSLLGGIALAANVLDRALASPTTVDERAREWVGEIRDGVARAALIAGSLQVAGSAVKTTPRSCTPAQLFDPARRAVQPLARARRARVMMDVRAGVDLVSCDQVLTIRALVALLSNALHRTPNGGRVRLVLWNAGAITHLAVHDEGDVLTDDEVDRLTAHAATDDARTAMPVSVARWAVGAQGGALKVGAGVDRGMVFDLHLPA